MPKISVILPVYNGKTYLEESINSILSQSYADFELLIINDGSKDESDVLIDQFNDPRIRIFHQQNMGLAATLNKGISLSRGEFIARQDQDDVSFSTRFEKQLQFLEAHPGVGMVGASAEIWNNGQLVTRYHQHPTDPNLLKISLLFNNYFVHSSVMIRRTVFDNVGVYSEDKSRQPPEDYELWSRISRQYKVANLSETLLAYREIPTSMSRTGNSPFLKNIVKITAENLAITLDLPDSLPEIVMLSKLLHADYSDKLPDIGFAKVADLLERAVMNTAQGCGMPEHEARLFFRNKLKQLRYRYMDYLSGGMVGSLANSALAKLARKMINKQSKLN